MLCKLFATDGVYRNTPFAEQRGHDAIAKYWQRVKLQQDIHLSYGYSPEAQPAAWPTGTSPIRLHPKSCSKSGQRRPEPILWPVRPRASAKVALDGILTAEFNESGLCQECRLWWHIVELGASA